LSRHCRRHPASTHATSRRRAVPADGLSIAGRPSGARLPAAIDALSPIADALGTIADIGPVRSLTQPLAAATWTLVGIAESLLEVRIVVARALAMRRICAAVLDAGAAVDGLPPQ
jgi:hypothetical protein